MVRTKTMLTTDQRAGTGGPGHHQIPATEAPPQEAARTAEAAVVVGRFV